jgi:murein DD-endopeptidase MepM/ murein hydrolase activator NlpD
VKTIGRWFLLLLLSSAVLIVLSGFGLQDETLPRFLGAPYYGTKMISSYFDHTYPNLFRDGTFTKYSGERWKGKKVGIGACLSTTNCYDGHNGIDIKMSYEPVLAAASGIVIKADWSIKDYPKLGYGLEIILQHQVSNILFQTHYGHLSAVDVVPGQTVIEGQAIGTSGATGALTGPHLHFDVKEYIDGLWRVVDPFGWNGKYRDPWSLERYGAVSWYMWKDPSLEIIYGDKK